jgi:type IV pilus assembly protein PilB
MKKTNKKLGELLLEAGLIDSFQLNSALSYQREWGGRLGSIIIRKGFVSEKELVSVLETQFGYTSISLEEIEKPSADVLDMVKVDIARKFCVFPVKLDGKSLVVAVADPTDLKALDDIGFILGVRLKPLLALESDIMNAIAVHYEGKSRPEKFVVDKEKLAELGRRKPGEAFDETMIERPRESSILGDTDEPRTEISQKALLEGLVDVLISKGVVTREELARKIRARAKQ